MSSTIHSLVPSQLPQPSSPLPSTVHSPSPSFIPNTQSIGHSILEKPDSTIQLVLQNPNGFSREHDCFSFQLALDQLKSISADILLFPETNINWSDFQVRQATNRHCRNTFRFSKQVYSHSQLVFDTPYQPGGTTTIITDNLVSRFLSSSTDAQLGRWSITHLSLARQQTLTILCCYQVCDQHISQVGPRLPIANNGPFFAAMDNTILIHANSSITIWTKFFPNWFSKATTLS